MGGKRVGFWGGDNGGGWEVREVDKIRLLHALKILVVGGWLVGGG